MIQWKRPASILSAVCLLAMCTTCSGKEGSDEDAETDMDVVGEADIQPDQVLDPDMPETDIEDDCEGVVCQDPCVFYVDLNVASTGDGLTPETAFSDVQSGIDATHELAGACCTCDVWVAANSNRAS